MSLSRVERLQRHNQQTLLRPSPRPGRQHQAGGETASEPGRGESAPDETNAAAIRPSRRQSGLHVGNQTFTSAPPISGGQRSQCSESTNRGKDFGSSCMDHSDISTSTIAESCLLSKKQRSRHSRPPVFHPANGCSPEKLSQATACRLVENRIMSERRANQAERLKNVKGTLADFMKAPTPAPMGWHMAKMHRECERRLDIIKGNDRIVHKINTANSKLERSYPGGEGLLNVERRRGEGSLNVERRRREAREIKQRNQKIHARLIKTKPVISRDSMKKDYEFNVKARELRSLFHSGHALNGPRSRFPLLQFARGLEINRKIFDKALSATESDHDVSSKENASGNVGGCKSPTGADLGKPFLQTDRTQRELFQEGVASQLPSDVFSNPGRDGMTTRFVSVSYRPSLQSINAMHTAKSVSLLPKSRDSSQQLALYPSREPSFSYSASLNRQQLATPGVWGQTLSGTTNENSLHQGASSEL